MPSNNNKTLFRNIVDNYLSSDTVLSTYRTLILTDVDIIFTNYSDSEFLSIISKLKSQGNLSNISNRIFSSQEQTLLQSLQGVIDSSIELYSG